jgi:hypothetical protein
MFHSDLFSSIYALEESLCNLHLTLGVVRCQSGVSPISVRYVRYLSGICSVSLHLKSDREGCAHRLAAMLCVKRPVEGPRAYGER